MIANSHMNKLAKNQVPAVFHSHVICRSVSPKFIESFCMETPCLCPSEGHKHGGPNYNVTGTSVTEFCY